MDTIPMIRKYRVTDIDNIVEIWLRASIQAHGFVPPEFWRAQADNMRKTYIPNSESWVYEQAGHVVGFFSLRGDNLAALFICPECQGKSIGQQLMQKAKSMRANIELCVYASNTQAIRFYAKQRFKIIGTRRDGHTGHDEILMTWGA